MPILIKNCKYADGTGIKEKDICIIDGKITEETYKTDYVVDAHGMIAAPGFVNAHTHTAMSVFRNYADDMLLKEWLEKKIWPLESRLDDRIVKISAFASCIEMIRSGTTLINEMYGFTKPIAESVLKSGIRGVVGYGMIDNGSPEKRKSELAEAEKARKLIAGKKLLSYAYCPHSVYTCSDELILEAAERAKKHDCILHMHASETREEVFGCMKKTGKKPVEHLHELGALTKKTVLAHCSWVSLREIELLAKTGASVAHCPVSNMKLANGDVAPVSEMIGKKVNVCFGTDGAASNNSQDIIETAKLAAIAQKNFRWNPKVMDSRQVFGCLSKNGYTALGLNGGALEAGMLGDVVLIDWKKANSLPFHCPYNMIAYSLKQENIDTVIVEGNPLMLERKLTNIDEHKILEEFQKEAERFLYC